MKQLIFSWLFVFITSILCGQSPRLEKRWFIHGQDTLPYLIHVPTGELSKYPLVIWLHGKGERGNDNQSQFKNGVEILLDSMLFNPNYQGYLLIPQCPVTSTWSFYDKTLPRIKMTEDTPRIQQALMALINDVIANEKVERKRIYLCGISMGGFGVWDIAMRYPDMFAAIVPICGGADPTRAVLIKHLPVWAFHGEKDSVVSSWFTTEIMQELKLLQSEILDSRYSLLKDVGHNAWYYALKETGLFSWLFSKKKK